jgi:hemolysin activation/secretion protein
MIAGVMALSSSAARAQVVVPAPADSGRIKPDAPRFAPAPSPAAPSISRESLPPPVNAPEGAESIRFTLKGIKLTGVTAFADDRFTTLYAPLVGRTISLKQVYELAASITRTYREEGYILSYAYVPDQAIASGTVTIAVAEGYLAQVVVDGNDSNSSITTDYIKRLTSEKPVTDKTIESTLLRLNDLPGVSYRAILSKAPGAPAAESILTLIPSEKEARASVNFDNFSSRYLGPHEVSGSYSRSFLPRQQTTLFGLTSIPFDRLNYVSLSHAYAVAPDLTLEGSASYTNSNPAYTLAPLDIESATTNFNLGINYQAIRQRDENLLLKLSAESRHVTSDILNTRLTRDEIRTLHAAASYDIRDGWGGANVINATLTQGLGILGASSDGARNLSRAEAQSDFTKLELSASRLQTLDDDWSALVQASGQIASGPLYASEEFGYGGQIYGRAYDSSEVVGDGGAEAAIELRYTGFRTMQPINVEPFVFYDYGFVTNEDAAQANFDSLSSAGGGVRFASIWGQAGMLAVAFPITRESNAPTYGLDSARILFQVAHNF